MSAPFPEACFQCKSTRCCLDHCCDWEDCACGDCEMCQGTAPLELSEMEREQRLQQVLAAEDSNTLDSCDTITDVSEVQVVPDSSPDVLRTDDEEGSSFQLQVHSVRTGEAGTTPSTEDCPADCNASIAQPFLDGKEPIEGPSPSTPTDDSASVSLQETTPLTMTERAALCAQQIREIDIEATKRKDQDFMDHINHTLSELRRVQLKFEEFENRSSMLFAQSAKVFSGLAREMENHEQNFTEYPVPVTIQHAAQILAERETIVCLSGHGLSMESGIPYIRDENKVFRFGFDLEHQLSFEPTLKLYESHPHECRLYYEPLRNLFSQVQPNEGHRALAHIQKLCRDAQLQFVHFTTNIDGLCNRADQDGDSSTESCAIEVAGNAFQLRCVNECSNSLVPASSAEEMFCEHCGGTMRPHVLWADESYQQSCHNYDTIQAVLPFMDCLLLVGTSFQTKFAQELIGTAFESGIPIIEINTDPVTEIGNVKQLRDSCSNVLPALLSELAVCFANKAGDRKVEPIVDPSS
eukprot:GILJ01006816.1.p1 GENE.GILJ01006816.1~~GILJ01006816.1.p1  ORF type:complete len:523 (-),score=56.69 GILJ01006816.1:163-1731(-)